MREGGSYWDAISDAWDRINIDSPATFLKTFDRERRPIGLLYAAHFCQSEVVNGGFAQFFWNSTGVLGPEATEGFRAIGQPKVAGVVAAACALFRAPYPRDRDNRQSILETIDRRVLSELNEQFWDLLGSEGGGFEAAADRFTAVLDEDRT